MKIKTQQVFLMAVLAALLTTACQRPRFVENRIKRLESEIDIQKVNLEDAEKEMVEAKQKLKEARGKTGEERKDFLGEASGKIETAWENMEGGQSSIRGYKPIFFLFYTGDRVVLKDQGDLRQPREVLFNISFKVLLTNYVPFYFGFTQKSYWQIFDKKHSRPFREHNFNPELFFDLSRSTNRGVFALQIGLEHESNGETVETSRSWNRAYLHPKVRFPNGLMVALKYWKRLDGGGGKATPQNPGGDDNPFIKEYLGSGELRLYWEFIPKYTVLTMFRKGSRVNSKTAQLDFRFPIPWSKGVFLQAYYFSGFGESLADYDQRVRKFGIGFATGNPIRGLMPAR